MIMILLMTMILLLNSTLKEAKESLIMALKNK